MLRIEARDFAKFGAIENGLDYCTLTFANILAG